MSVKLTPVQAEVLARLTNEWQNSLDLVGPFSPYRRRRGKLSTLGVLLKLGLAERRQGRYHTDFRLTQSAP